MRSRPLIGAIAEQTAKYFSVLHIAHYLSAGVDFRARIISRNSAKNS